MRRTLSRILLVSSILLVPLAFLFASHGAVATPQGKTCSIPKGQAVRLHIRAGEQVTIACNGNDGTISISRGALLGSPPAPATRVPVAVPGGPASTGSSAPALAARPTALVPASGARPGPAANRLHPRYQNGSDAAWCYNDSVLYDNSEANIVLTEYQLSLYWSYDYSAITDIWQGYEGWYYDSDTGWELDDHAAYIYEPDYENGVWVDNGYEGWGDFSEFGSVYQHEHHMIMWVDADGLCTGDNYFWGDIPGWSYEEFYVYQ